MVKLLISMTRRDRDSESTCLQPSVISEMQLRRRSIRLRLISKNSFASEDYSNLQRANSMGSQPGLTSFQTFGQWYEIVLSVYDVDQAPLALDRPRCFYHCKWSQASQGGPHDCGEWHGWSNVPTMNGWLLYLGIQTEDWTDRSLLYSAYRSSQCICGGYQIVIWRGIDK